MKPMSHFIKRETLVGMHEALVDGFGLTNEYRPASGKIRCKCAGPEGCGYEGDRAEFWHRHQTPFKCPQCEKTHTFRTWSNLVEAGA